MTKLTICMPVYNCGKYLRRSIESILQQTYGDFILSIYDDGSVDESVPIIKSFNDKRIKLIDGGENKGGLYARTQLINALDTEYCMWCDADDKFAHDKAFEISMNLMDSSGYDWIDFERFYEIHLDGSQCICPPVECQWRVFKGSEFFALYYPNKTSNFLNSKIFRSELMKKCIPDEKYLGNKYVTHDIFFTVMWYFHTRSVLKAGIVPPLYSYFTNIGYFGSRQNDFSLERTRKICIAFHDCLENALDKIMKTRELLPGEERSLVAGMMFNPFVYRMGLIRKNCSSEVLEQHIDIIHEYFMKDGSHVLNGCDFLEMPSWIEMFEKTMRIGTGM